MTVLYGLDCPVCGGIDECTSCLPGIRYGLGPVPPPVDHVGVIHDYDEEMGRDG